MSYIDDIQKAYVAYYGRPADTGGLNFWVAKLQAANGDMSQVINAFGNSVESNKLYASDNLFAKVTSIYNTLFGRDPDAPGAQWYVDNINAGKISLASAALAIYNGAQGADKVTVASKLAYAEAFTTALANSNSTALLVGYAGDNANAAARDALKAVFDNATLTSASSSLSTTLQSVANAGSAQNSVGQTFTLTTGIDTIAGTAGNDTINAATSAGADTFTSLDKIDGGAGTDTLNLVSAGGDLTTASGATVTNVEVVNLSSGAAITAADVSGWTGVNTLNVASGKAISGVKASATTDINVANGLAGVSVDGGKNVTISNSTAGAVSVGAATAAAGNVTATNSFIDAAGVTGTVAIKGAGALTATAAKGAITLTNGTSATATASKAVSLADQTAHTTAATAAATAYTAATTGNGTDASGVALTKVQAAATGFTALAAALAPAGAAATYSADQAAATSIGLYTTAAVTAGSITAAQKVSIDAAFIAALATSPAAARVAALAVVTPLQAANTAAVAAAVTADAANDAALLAAKTAADAAVAADNAIAANVKEVTVTATTNTALASATVSGNYGAATTKVGTGLAFQNAIYDSSALGNTLTSVTLSNTGASELKGQALTNVSATGMNADVSVTNTTAAHTQNFTLSGIKGGTFTDANATTVNIVGNGTATNVLTGLSATLATKVNVTGSAGVNFGTTTLDAAAVVDASANSGSNTISIAAGQTYIGGTGADTVTAGAFLQTKAVDGGAGTADKLILTNNAAFGTTGAALFKNFEVAQINNGVTADLSKFTNSAFTSVVLHGATTEADGLNAVQAAHITIDASTTATIGVAGATTVGQIDTVGLTIDDGLAAKNTITLTTPTLTGVEILNITANDHLTIGAGGFANALALTNVNISGAGNISLVEDQALNVNTVFDAHTVTGTVSIDASGSSANGLKIIGSLTAVNTLKGNATLTNTLIGGDAGDGITGGSAIDVITAGNGNNVIDGKGGADVITLGNGNNSVNAGGIAYTGNLTVTAGNGYNVIVGGAGADKITVGTGGNLVTGGAGADTITFGTHVAGVTDGIVMAAAGDTLSTATVAAMVTAAATNLTGADIVTGMQAGDTIKLAAVANTVTGALGTALASTAGATAELVRGIYDTTAHTFTASATGNDSLVSYDADGTGAGAAIEAIVLVGYHGTAATAAAGLITLG